MCEGRSQIHQPESLNLNSHRCVARHEGMKHGRMEESKEGTTARIFLGGCEKGWLAWDENDDATVFYTVVL